MWKHFWYRIVLSKKPCSEGATVTDEYPDMPEQGPAPEPAVESAGDEEPSTRPAWFWWAIGGGVLIAILALLFLLRTPEVVTPKVVGLDQPTAEKALTAVGLRVGKVSEVETLAAAPGIIVEQSPEAEAKAAEGSAVDISVAKLPVVTVPDVLGKPVSEADELVAAEGLRPGEATYEWNDTVAAGLIIAQEPAAGTQATVGAFVNVKVSKGTQQEQIPNVVGLAASDAEAVLEADGFAVKTVKAESTTVPAGDVIAQSPAAGVVTDPGSTVTITVSTGAPQAPVEQPPAEQPPATGSGEDTNVPETPEKPAAPQEPTTSLTEIPNVVGMRVLEAARELRKAQLKVHFEFAPSDEFVLRVSAQDPKAGASVDRGTVVNLTIGLPSFALDAQPAPLPAQPTVTPQPSVGASGSSESTSK